MAELSSWLRWHLKKSSRKSVAILTWSCGRFGAPESQPRARVLTYHRFGNAVRDPFTVTPEDFELQMAWLARLDLAVSLSDIEEFIAGRRSLPNDSVLVTIDDGAPSFYAKALPILQRYGIPSVLFVPAGELRDGPESSSAENPDSRMTRDHLVEISNAGVTVGSHAWTHRSLARMSLADARDQAVRSRAALEDLLGVRVTSFAYPFGTRADYNAATGAVLREAGYTSAFTSQHGSLGRGCDVMTLPRVKVEGGENIWMFQCLSRGGLDGWRWIDRTLWQMQAAGE